MRWRRLNKRLIFFCCGVGDQKFGLGYAKFEMSIKHICIDRYMSLEFQREGSVLENLNLGVIRAQMLFKPQNV